VKPAAPLVPPKRPVAAPAPVPAPSFVDDLMANPLLLPVSAVVLLLLGVLGLRSARRRKLEQTFTETNVLTDSGLKTNSLFGSTGGQSVDTNNSVFNSGFAPSASQLDTNEVDPVAEADVYIAYGRDAQAEEILKESLRTQPERQAVRGKLLEIYASRKDLRSFETVASELYSLTKGEGEEWRQAAILGHSLDAKNPLYAGGKPSAGASKQAANLDVPGAPGATQSLDELDLDALLNTTQASAVHTEPVPHAAPESGTFSADEKNGPETLTKSDFSNSEAGVPEHDAQFAMPSTPAAPLPSEATHLAHAMDNTMSRLSSKLKEAEPVAPLDFDFDLAVLGLNNDAVKAAKASDGLPELDAPSNGLDFESLHAPTHTAPKEQERDPIESLMANQVPSTPDALATPAILNAPQHAPQHAPEHAPDTVTRTPLDFDLSDITLDLDPVQERSLAASAPDALPAPEGSANAAELATKLDLALAYEEIGDKEGARELLDEVVKGGHPELSEKARSLLEKLA
jgi:pilus assembly protein FimV